MKYKKKTLYLNKNQKIGSVNDGKEKFSAYR